MSLSALETAVPENPAGYLLPGLLGMEEAALTPDIPPPRAISPVPIDVTLLTYRKVGQ